MPDCTYQVEELELMEQSDSDDEPIVFKPKNKKKAHVKAPKKKKKSAPIESTTISLISDDEESFALIPCEIVQVAAPSASKPKLNIAPQPVQAAAPSVPKPFAKS